MINTSDLEQLKKRCNELGREISSLINKSEGDQGEVVKADKEDLPEILALQKLAFYNVAKHYRNFRLGPLQVTLEDIEKNFSLYTYYKVNIDGSIIASARIKFSGDVCKVENVIVHPDYQGMGYGRQLMTAVEGYFPGANMFVLFTGKDTPGNVPFYESLGYCIVSERAATLHEPVLVTMNKMV